MDTRTDLQRLLEDMDKMIKFKQQELSELDDRLEAARTSLSEREARELMERDPARDSSSREGLIADQVEEDSALRERQRREAELEEYIKEQRVYYEQRIANLNDECAELEAANRRLVKLKGELEFEVDSLKVSVEKLRVKLRAQDECLEEVQSANFELNIRLAKAESESQMQQRLLKKSHEQDQVLLEAFKLKLGTLNRAISRRDEEIRLLRKNERSLMSMDSDANSTHSNQLADSGARAEVEQVEEAGEILLFSQLQGGGRLVDSGQKSGIIKVAKLIRDKDAQIELLKEQLLQTTTELEHNTQLLKSLHSGVHQEPQFRWDGNEMINLARDNGQSERLEGVALRCRMLEAELESKDKQIHELEWRNHQLEVVVPSDIVELVNELKSRALTEGSTVGKLATERGADKAVEGGHLSRTLSSLTQKLVELLGRLSESQELLTSTQQLKMVLLNKDRHIQRLVNELNRLGARINQEPIDMVPACDIIGPHNNAVNEVVPIMGEQLALAAAAAAVETTTTTTTTSSGRMQEDSPNMANEPMAINGQLSEPARAQSESTNDRADLIGGGVQALAKESDRRGAAETRASSESSQSNGMSSELSASREQQQHVSRASVCAEKVAHLPVEDPVVVAVANSKPDTSPLETIEPLVNVGSSTNSSKGWRALIKQRPFRRTPAPSYLRTRMELSKRKRSYNNSRPGGGQRDAGNNKSNSLERAPPPGALNRLRQLENENQLLELAMKEILVSIKWSDARCSTMLIDCPSLERLCQLIEARHMVDECSLIRSSRICSNDDDDDDDEFGRVNSDERTNSGVARYAHEWPSGGERSTRPKNLFQLIVMKSELDLLRGQNEQLRSDLKSERKEYQDCFVSKVCKDHLSSTPPTKQSHFNQSAELSARYCEAESQTESTLMAHVVLSEERQRLEETTGDGSAGERCRKCARLVKLANHLLDCIGRIESRVNSSDELYISRLLTLYQLTRRLSEELVTKEDTIGRYQRERHSLARQKASMKNRLELLENQMAIHSDLCPISFASPIRPPNKSAASRANQRSANFGPLAPLNGAPSAIQLYAPTGGARGAQLEHKESVSRLCIIEDTQSRGAMNLERGAEFVASLKASSENKITIALLQSIITCLQARIDYKDERLSQLEQLLAADG